MTTKRLESHHISGDVLELEIGSRADFASVTAGASRQQDQRQGDFRRIQAGGFCLISRRAKHPAAS